MIDNDSIPTDFLDQLRIKHTQSHQQPENLIQKEESHTVEYFESNHHHNAAQDEESTEMPHEARRVLVSLLRYGVILFSQKAKLFESLCRYQDLVRKHLAAVYLRLVLDEKAGLGFVASIQRVDEDDSKDSVEEESVSLISRRTLSLYETLLLLVLRKHYQDRETSGEQRIIIDVERVDSYMSAFLPLSNSTKTDRRKLKAVLEKMMNRKILSLVRGSEDRFEITPIIRYVVSAEFLESMLKEYLKIAAENGISVTVQAPT
jgi:hypothetical protein